LGIQIGCHRPKLAAVRILAWLTETFIATFGITRPRPEQQRQAEWLIGGFLLAFLMAAAGLVVFFLVSVRR
jgi:hypothetical protein